MKWAPDAIEKLARRERVSVRPRGQSMQGLIEDGQLVWLEPAAPERWEVGDIVLVSVRGKKRELIVLHQILEIDGERALIGARNGRVDGWVELASILGRSPRVDS